MLIPLGALLVARKEKRERTVGVGKLETWTGHCLALQLEWHEQKLIIRKASLYFELVWNLHQG